MALSVLGRAAFQLRWDNFLKAEGSSLFLELKAAPKDSEAYEAAMYAVLDGLKSHAEYDFCPRSQRDFIEEQLDKNLLKASAGETVGGGSSSRGRR